MRIVNADGSDAETCGNGIRCVARYLHERRAASPRKLAIETASGIVRTEVVAGAPAFTVRAAMGAPGNVRVYDDHLDVGGGVAANMVDVSMGNPHSVAFVDTDLDALDLPAMASEISARGKFEHGVNVEVARVLGDAVDMRVFERGVGETLACGTGACAVAVAAIATGRAQSPVRIAMRGGDVVVAWAVPDDKVYLTGGAEIVFDADVDVHDSLVLEPAAPVA
jgi:diaminopimelate epimerase